MKLISYLQYKRVSKTRAAKELNITRQYLYQIMSGKMGPGRKLAIKILKWSDGEVRFEDLWS
jgi:DNA-binding XRE family transcriptional regulator